MVDRESERATYMGKGSFPGRQTEAAYQPTNPIAPVEAEGPRSVVSSGEDHELNGQDGIGEQPWKV